MQTRTSGVKRTGAKTARSRSNVSAIGPKGAPSIADLRRIARSIVTATSVNDEKRMLSLYADAVESEEPGQAPRFGIESIKKKFEQWGQMVSNQTWHARNLWVDGQTVLIEWEAQLTMRPNGKKLLLKEVAIHEIRNGKIVRERFYYDPAPFRS